ncbi:hypothetical protein, partial [Amycolatopsis magusensis]
DAKSKDVIIKLVNLLPVPVTSSVDLQGLSATAGKGVKSVLQGKPTDKLLKPLETTVAVADLAKMELPAYSCTVVRLEGKPGK